jgi:hypothetical protein
LALSLQAFFLSCKLTHFAGLRSGAEQDKAKGAQPPQAAKIFEFEY